MHRYEGGELKEGFVVDDSGVQKSKESEGLEISDEKKALKYVCG